MRTEKEIREKIDYVIWKSRVPIEKNVYSYGKVQLLKWVLKENTNKKIKVTKENQLEMRRLRKKGMKLKDVAEKFGVCQYTVRIHTIKGELEKHIERSNNSQKRKLEKIKKNKKWNN